MKKYGLMWWLAAGAFTLHDTCLSPHQSRRFGGRTPEKKEKNAEREFSEPIRAVRRATGEMKRRERRKKKFFLNQEAAV